MKTDQKILNYQQIGNIGHSNKVVVLITGCFDILHLGHMIFLNYSKEQGDVLVVGVASDETVRELKGSPRPLNPEIFRARQIAALEVVDYVIINHEPLEQGNIDHSVLVSILKPALYVVPETDRNISGKKALVERFGGVFKTCKRLPPNHLKGGISSTEIISKIENMGL